MTPASSSMDSLSPVASFKSLSNSISFSIFCKNLPRILPIMNPRSIIIIATTNLFNNGESSSIVFVANCVNDAIIPFI